MVLLRRAPSVVQCVIAGIVITLSPTIKTSECQQSDARWPAIARALGREGTSDDGYYRVEFPRRDLSVTIGDHTLDPAFELTSYFAFVPTSPGKVLSMGELVLRADEVSAVMDEARRRKVSVPALHNHLIGETPRIMYVHVMIAGDAADVAQKLHALLARTATPLGKQPDEPKGNKRAWAAMSAALGEPEEAEPEIAEWEFARREAITEGGVAVKSSGLLETRSGRHPRDRDSHAHGA